MKIRNGFVTNSSSTSFIIMTKEKLTPEYLAEKLGIKKDSLNYSEVLDLCSQIVKDGKDGFYHHRFEDTNKKLVEEIFGKKTANKYEKLLKKGYNLYSGSLSSEVDDFQSILCVDSFIIDNKDFYMDASCCVW